MAVAKGVPIHFPPPPPTSPQPLSTFPQLPLTSPQSLVTFPHPPPIFRHSLSAFLQKLMTSAPVEGTLASAEGVPVSVEGTSARAVMTLADAADFFTAKEVIFRHDFCHRVASESIVKTSGGQSKTEFVACNAEIGSCNAEIMVCNDRFRP